MKIIICLFIMSISNICFSLVNDETPVPSIHAAAYEGSIRYLEKKINYDNIDSIDHRGRTPLHHAIMGNQLEAVIYLISKGANKDALDISGVTPLIYAIVEGNKVIIQYLINLGCNPDGLSENSITPLCTAVKLYHYNIVELLLKSGSDVNKSSYGNRSALYYSVDNLIITKKLLEHKADINVFTEDLKLNDGTILYGESVLHRGIFHQNIEVIKLLLENGADINIDHGDGRTTLEVANDTGNEEIIRLIGEHMNNN